MTTDPSAKALPQVLDAPCLRYKPDSKYVEQAENIIAKYRATGDLWTVLRETGEEAKMYTGASRSGAAKCLLVFFTDLEPDDSMAICQVLASKRKAEEDVDVLLIFMADFCGKDGGTIFEKKRAILALLTGITDESVHILTCQEDKGHTKFEDGTEHPMNPEIVKSRSSALQTIGEKIAKHQGDAVELYMIAPGFGNIGAILDSVKVQAAWPLPGRRWSVSMYSGAFNTKGTRDEDIAALSDILKCAETPLMDVGRFPFFGGKDCHPSTDSLASFMDSSFAQSITDKHPLAAAMLKSFNDEFNIRLVHPANKNLFKDGALTPQEQERVKYLHQTLNEQGPQAYASKLMMDEALFKKIPAYKHSTVKAFALDGCDSPLCDQLTFLGRWLWLHQPELLRAEEGCWVVDKDKGFTTVDTSRPGGIRAVQLKLSNPKDEVALRVSRKVLQEHLLDHLAALQPFPA